MREIVVMCVIVMFGVLIIMSLPGPNDDITNCQRCHTDERLPHLIKRGGNKLLSDHKYEITSQEWCERKSQ